MNNIKIYEQDILQNKQQSIESPINLDPKYFEILKQNQSLTDFCHTSLRTSSGLNITSLEAKYAIEYTQDALKRLEQLKKQDLVLSTQNSYSLSNQGKMISFFDFEKLVF